ncbi:helix-turn-helix domain-containing protein [Kurthia huakuii]|nr:helix-turn-helix domain-containing protein [Kurthia huakuii]
MILFCMFLIPEIGQATAVKFSTLEAICEALDCQPGDSLAYEKNNDGDL